MALNFKHCYISNFTANTAGKYGVFVHVHTDGIQNAHRDACTVVGISSGQQQTAGEYLLEVTSSHFLQLQGHALIHEYALVFRFESIA